MSVFSWKGGQRSRLRDVENLKKLPHMWRYACLLTGGGSSVGGSGADCKLGLTIFRPNLLSTPEAFGNWTDGRISCRHSAPLAFLLLNLLPSVPVEIILKIGQYLMKLCHETRWLTFYGPSVYSLNLLL